MKTIQNIFKERTSSSKIYEVGPGRQLRAMISRIDRTLLDDFTNVETWHKLLNFEFIPKCFAGEKMNLHLSESMEHLFQVFIDNLDWTKDRIKNLSSGWTSWHWTDQVNVIYGGCVDGHFPSSVK